MSQGSLLLVAAVGIVLAVVGLLLGARLPDGTVPQAPEDRSVSRR